MRSGGRSGPKRHAPTTRPGTVPCHRCGRASHDHAACPACRLIDACQHESCHIVDETMLEPGVRVILADCQDCPARVSWRETPGAHGPRVGVQVEDVQHDRLHEVA